MGGHAVVDPLNEAAEERRLAAEARAAHDEATARVHDDKAYRHAADAAARSAEHSARLSVAGEYSWNRRAACYLYFHCGRSLVLAVFAALNRRKRGYGCKFCRRGSFETWGTACDACKKKLQKR